MKKIDIHVHTERERRVIGQATMPSVSDVLETVLEAEGADHGILLTGAIGTNGEDRDAAYRASCELAATLVEEHPHALSWCCNLDPRMDGLGPDADLVPVLAEYRSRGAVGFGETTVNLPWDDPYIENLLRALEIVGLPIIAHMDIAVGVSYGVVDDPGLPRLEGALRKFPGLTFVGHSQVFWSEIEQDTSDSTRGGYPEGSVIPGRLQHLLRTYPNLYADLSARSGYNALVRDRGYTAEFLGEFADKLMYGSDYLFPREPVRTGALLDELRDGGRLDHDAYAKIVRNNAISVFGLTDRQGDHEYDD